MWCYKTKPPVSVSDDGMFRKILPDSPEARDFLEHLSLLRATHSDNELIDYACFLKKLHRQSEAVERTPDEPETADSPTYYVSIRIWRNKVIERMRPDMSVNELQKIRVFQECIPRCLRDSSNTFHQTDGHTLWYLAWHVCRPTIVGVSKDMYEKMAAFVDRLPVAKFPSPVHVEERAVVYLRTHEYQEHALKIPEYIRRARVPYATNYYTSGGNETLFKQLGSSFRRSGFSLEIHRCIHQLPRDAWIAIDRDIWETWVAIEPERYEPPPDVNQSEYVVLRLTDFCGIGDVNLWADQTIPEATNLVEYDSKCRCIERLDGMLNHQRKHSIIDLLRMSPDDSALVQLSMKAYQAMWSRWAQAHQ